MGKTALITGASRGIGRATAELLARQGFAVAVNYVRSQRAAEELAAALRAQGADAAAFQADVADLGQVEAMISAVEKRLGPVRVLVNNAGVAAQRLFTDITPAEWNAMLGVHVNGAYHCCRCVLPSMIREKRGKIVNVSSIWGITGASCEVHYSTAKAAIIGLTRRWPRRWGRRASRSTASRGGGGHRHARRLRRNGPAGADGGNASGPPGHPGGDGGGHRFPGLRRGGFHHRPGAGGQRRIPDINANGRLPYVQPPCCYSRMCRQR